MFKKISIVLLTLVCIVNCGEEQSSAEQTTELQPASESNISQTTEQTFHAPRTWDNIKRSGYIRALKLTWEDENHLPRSGSTSLFHRQLLNDFAEFHQLEVRWVMVDNIKQMFDALTQYKADIIPRHLTITEQRLEHVAFTDKLDQDTEVVIGRADAKPLSKNDTITVHAPEGTSYVDSIKQFSSNWSIHYLKTSLSDDDLADALAQKKIDYSVLDQSAVNTLLQYRNDIRIVKTLPEQRVQAWALHKYNRDFLQKLNDFIAAHHVEQSTQVVRTHDLNIIKSQPLTLRMITRNSPETYFLWRGELMGFEYDLMKEFTRQHNIKLDVIVADEFQEMIDLLNNGQGDVIAAAVSRTEQRQQEHNFSIRYNRVAEKIVAHASSNIESLEDLKGRTISVRQSSAFWHTAQELAKTYGANVIAADESLSTELLIGQVADQSIELTIADSNLIDIEQSFRDDIIAPITLNENIPYAYMVRDNNPKLLAALNAFIRKEYRQTFYNVVKNKYFANQKRKEKHREQRITEGSNLSPYDPVVQKHARRFQFDWRLITSQMYQESRFNPKAKSHAGAQGLMQVLPRTAKELGYSNLTDPKESIAAGVEYLNWTRERFSSDLPVEERLYFALAAYNAGYGHVKDAQKLAEKMNLDPNVWFNNVERAMLLLQKPKYYKKTRFGYCRGSEPVNYVRDIHQRYLSYVTIAR